MSDLRTFLNQLQSSYHRSEFLSSDPLEFVHRYENPWDQEVIALFAALLAYGNVKQIRKSIQEAIRRISQLSESPHEFIRSLDRPAFRRKAYSLFEGYVHRFNVGSDMVLLGELIHRSWAEHGSVGGLFLAQHAPDAPNIGPALNSLVQTWESWLPRNYSQTVDFFLASPAKGSCCKRWCMFLRWMVRNDDLDLGLWTSPNGLSATFGAPGPSIRTSQLVMPLDTHTGRISQYLGLTARSSLNWRAALEITENLKSLDPIDPTRYDFALSRLGILDICQRTYREEICHKCQLRPACRFANKHLKPRTSSTRSVA